MTDELQRHIQQTYREVMGTTPLVQRTSELLQELQLEIIDNAVEMQRAKDMKTSEQLTLGELILKLEAIEDKSKSVIFDEQYHPTGLDSWRGSYCELALEYEETGKKLSAEALLRKLKDAIGATFYGYKGGEFLMGKTSPVWVANYGYSGGFKADGDVWTQAVVDVSQSEESVVLETRNI